MQDNTFEFLNPHKNAFCIYSKDFKKQKFYNGLFGSTNKRPNFCKHTVAASALAFFLFSLAIVGWNSCPLTVTLKIYCFLCAGPTSKSWTKLGGPHLPKK